MSRDGQPYVTVRVVVAVRGPLLAVTVVVPGPRPVAIPVARMVATAVADDDHVTCPVTVAVEPSL